MVGPIDASSPRLLVQEVCQSSLELLLRCHPANGGSDIYIVLRDAWALSEPIPTTLDIVRVVLCSADFDFVPWTELAEYSKENPLVVDDLRNIFILNPDTLVSSTAVADSFGCLRKAVLASRIPHGIAGGPVSAASLCGSMIHDLFQVVITMSCNLRAESVDEDLDVFAVSAAVEDVLTKHMEDIYAASMTQSHARNMLMSSLPGILDWASTFLGPNACAPVSDNRKIRNVSVPAIRDIEELVWSPTLGLKGKFDVSIDLCDADMRQSIPHVAPMELKTGTSKGFAGISHHAQVVLYTVLMSERHNISVKRGLLSYIRVSQIANDICGERIACTEHVVGQNPKSPNTTPYLNVPKRPRLAVKKDADDYETGTTRDIIVNVVRDELIGLVMQRNRLAYYLKTDADVTALPPMVIGKTSMCEKCFCVDSCMIQHKLIENGDAVSAQKYGPSGELFSIKTDHLESSQANYYIFWRQVMAAEEALAGKNRAELWSMPAFERQAAGRCWVGLSLKVPESQLDAKSSDRHARDGILLPGTRLPFEFYPSHKMNPDFVRNMSSAHLSVGDYVVVSVQCLSAPDEIAISSVRIPAVAGGFVEAISDLRICVRVDRHLWHWSCRLHSSPESLIWRIDSEEIFASFNTAKSNIETLFAANDVGKCGKLRNLVVDLHSPKFAALPDSETIFLDNFCRELSAKGIRLNEEQRRALRKSLQAQDYLLILGMPGTGKTATLAAIVLAVARRGCTVFLCSHTRAAVDNVLSRLLDLEFTDFVRVGRPSRVSDPRLESYYVTSGRYNTTEELAAILEKPAVVASTCLGINHAVFAKRPSFDLVLIDEASQILQPICVGPLRFAASAFVLVGDHYQLPPLMRSLDMGKMSHFDGASEATGESVEIASPQVAVAGFSSHAGTTSGSESLFRRLCEAHPSAVVSLVRQYRMAQEIMDISNELVYNGKLSCGSSEVAKQMLNIELRKIQTNSVWLKSVLNPARRLLFLDTDSLKDSKGKHGDNHDASKYDAASKTQGLDSQNSILERQDGARRNETEAKIIAKASTMLMACGLSADDIAILTPYRAQIGVIRKAINCQDKHEHCPEICTVDQYQGKDKSCVFFSLVTCVGRTKVGRLLQDWRRVNVAITRARSKLILVGSASALGSGGHFLESLIASLHSRNAVKPVDGFSIPEFSEP